MPRSYTLGGFYLARYADSPVGQFDEVSCRCFASRFNFRGSSHSSRDCAAGGVGRVGVERPHIMRMGGSCVRQQLVSVIHSDLCTMTMFEQC